MRMKWLTCVAMITAAGAAAAADGVWTNGAGLWNDASKWLDGVVPGPGDAAAFTGGGGTVTVPAGSPFTLSALRFNTNGADAAWTVAGETSTLVSPAEIRVDANAAALDAALTGSAGFTKTGSGLLTLTSAENSFSGTVTVAGGILRLGADEVLPHGAGQGTLVIGGAQNGILDLNGKTETVNRLINAGQFSLTNSAGTPGVLRAGLDVNDMGVYGEVQAQATLQKIGTGKLFFADNGRSQGGITVSEGSLYCSRASVLGTMTVTLDGGTLVLTNTQPGLIESVATIPDAYLHPWMSMLENASRLGTYMGNLPIPDYPYYTQFGYKGLMKVPSAGLYSFAKNFDNGGYLAIDGVMLISNNVLESVTVTQNVSLVEGWHTVDIFFSQGVSGVGPNVPGFTGGIMFDPANGPFTNAAEIAASAKRFEDPGDGSLLRTPDVSGTNVFRAHLELAQDATFDRSGTAASLVWAGDLVPSANAAGTPMLAVAGGAEPFRVGSTGRSSVFGVDVDDENGVLFQNKVWLLSLPDSSSWSIVSGADVAAGTPGILGTGAMTLTDYSLRIPASDALGAGGETVTVEGTGNTAWFDATRETGGRLIDDPAYAFTASNNVVFNGTGARVGFDGAGTVNYTGAISGSGSLVKTGGGDAVLASANSFAGGVQVSAGRLLVNGDAALGDAANSVTLAGGYLGNASGSPLALARSIQATAGGFSVAAGDSLTLSGALSGTAAKQGAGTLTVSGTAANGSFDLAVDEGVAVLDKSGAAAVRHIIRVASNAVARLSGSGGNQIGGNVTLTGGSLDLNGLSETVGRLSSARLSSAMTNGGASPAVLTVGEGGATSTYLGGLADGAGGATVGLTKTGNNVFALAGAAGTQTATGGLSVEGGTLALGAGLRYVRFTPLATRTPGALPSVGEFQLLRDGQPLAWPTGTTASATSVFDTNVAARLIDNNSKFGWQAGASVAAIKVTLPVPVLFDGYRWYTGRDASCDPVAWTVEVSADNSAWFTADSRTNQAAAILVNRGVLAGAYTLSGTAWPNDAVSPDSDIAVAAGAVLRVALQEEGVSGLTGMGEVALDNGAALHVDDVSTFGGTFSGTGGRLLLGDDAALDIPSIKDEVTVVNGGAAPAAVTVGAGGEPLFAGALTDGAAPLGLVKRGGGTTLLVDAGSTYTGDTRVEEGTLAVQPNVWSFRYIRFSPTWTLANNAPNNGFALAIAEFQLLRNGAAVAYPAGTTATTPYEDLSSAPPVNAANNSIADRWVSVAVTNALTIDTKVSVTFDGYRYFATSLNVADYGRAPTAWTVEGSRDGVTWVQLDRQSGVVIPPFASGVNKEVGPFSAKPARCKLPQDFWAATNSAALRLAGVSARYLRFTVTAARVEDTLFDNSSSGFQLAELQLLTNGAPVLYPAGTSVTAPGGSFYGGSFPPIRAVDNDTSGSNENRWYSDAMVNPLTVDMKRQVSFDSYRFFTAWNVSGRDPKSWTLEVSNNTTNWYTVDVRTNQTVTTTRSVATQTWALEVPAGQLGTDAIPDGSRTRVSAGATLRIGESALETVGPLSGTGTVTLVSAAVLGINAFDDAVFEGNVTGTGTVSVAGDGLQTFRGGTLGFKGEIIVDGGVLELDGVTLSGVTNITLSGEGEIAGGSSVSGNLTVTFAGGAYRASLAVSGALTVTGPVAYALPEDAVFPYYQTLFTFGSADAATRAALAAGKDTLTVPAGYVATVRVTPGAAYLSVASPGSVLMVR